MNVPFANKEAIAKSLDFSELIQSLKEAFAQGSIETPTRHHHDYANPKAGIDSTLLLMPSWEVGADLGVKLVTVSPKNTDLNLPLIHGLYILFNAVNGSLDLLLDAKELTSRRTAAASALASSLLSNKDSHTLMVVGTGELAPHLIRAHSAVRPISKVLVWGRNQKKAEKVRAVMAHEVAIEVVQTIEGGMKQADIVSCATLSSEALILGQYFQPRQHIDLVGSFKPDMREADDEAISKSRLFVDTEIALKESGDLVIPLANGVMTEKDVQANLFDLCSGAKAGRKTKEEITLFKSVGHALEDLVAARLVKKLMDSNQ